MIRRRLGAVVGIFVLVAVPLFLSLVHPAHKASASLVDPGGGGSYSITAQRLDEAHIQVVATGTTTQNNTTLDMSVASGVYFDRNTSDSIFEYRLGGDMNTGVPKGCKQSLLTVSFDSNNNEVVNYDVYLTQVNANSSNCVEVKLQNQFFIDSGIGFDLNVGVPFSAIQGSPKGILQSVPPQVSDYNYVTYFLNDSTTIYTADGDPAFNKDSGYNNKYLFKQAPNGNFELQSGGLGGHGCPDLISIITPGVAVDLAHYTTRKTAKDGTCNNYQTFEIALLASSPLTQASPSAGGGTATTGPGNNNGGSNECGITNELAWIVCPILTGLNWFTNQLDGAIGSLLTIDTAQVFSTTGQYYAAWSNVRNLAMGLIVISAVVAIGSETLGLELVSAYTFRKIAPRFFLAVAFMVFAWPVLELVVKFFNDLGNWIGDIMTSPFNGLQDYSYSSDVSKALGLVPGVGAGVIIGIGAWWGVGGFAGLLSLVGTAALGLLVGFIVLEIRNMIVLLALLASPIIIAAYILPGTRKAGAFGKDAFITALAMFPIVMMFVSSGKIVARVEEASTSNGFLKAAITTIAYVIPYFLLPIAFRMAGGLVSTVTGMVNDRSRGGFDRLRGVRGNSRARMHQERMNDSNASNAVTRGLNSAYRRIAMANQGGLSMTTRGRNRFHSAEQKHMNATVNEMVENDAGRAGGDDDATALASRTGMSRNQFVNDYMTRTGRSREEAQAALAQMETNFGARMGSNAMMVAAWKARAASVTGYQGNDAGLTELMNDARRMRASGLITATDAAAAIKANKARGDQSSIGFGELLNQIGENGAVTQGQVDRMRASAREGMLPGALASQRHETVSAMAPTIMRELDQTADRIRTAQTPNDRAAAVRDFKQQMASVAGLHDTMSQIAPQNAKILADNVLNQDVNVGDIPELAGFNGANNVTKRVSVQSMIDGGGVYDANGAPVMVTDSTGRQVQAQAEGLRGDSHFKEMRREYATTSAAQAQAIQNAQGGGGIQGGPPPVFPIR